jgi:hypothetical protein
MRFQPIRWSFTFAVVGLLCYGPLLLAQSDDPTETKKIEMTPCQIRAALNKKVTLDFESTSLNEAIAHLRGKTKLPFIVDEPQLNGMDLNNGGNNLPPGLAVSFKLQGTKVPVRVALRKMLEPYNLGFAIVGDTVLISTEEQAAYRQFTQRVNVDAQGMTLSKVLQQLADETGVNVLIDQRVEKQAERSVTAQFDDVPVDSAVRLVSEVASLKAIQVDNVLLITTPEHAARIRQEELEDRNMAPDSATGGSYGRAVVAPAGVVGPARPGAMPRFQGPPAPLPPVGAPVVQPPFSPRVVAPVGSLTRVKR